MTGRYRIRALAIVGLALLGTIAAGELWARYWLGLGTPPLSITHPTIEYMFAPDQEVLRFGKRNMFNHFGMRSEQIGEKLPGEFRVMALGDSVLNGGALTDHLELATTILTDAKTSVLNASAGSWGPENLLAYVKAFGFFDSDLMVLVLNSGDADDQPAFAPLDPSTHPVRYPISALLEGMMRYLPRYLPSFSSNREIVPIAAFVPRSVPAIRALIRLAGDAGIPACIVLHISRGELRTGQFLPGHDAIESASLAEGARFIETKPLYAHEDFRDDIHLNGSGQKKLAAAMRQCFPSGP